MATGPLEASMTGKRIPGHMEGERYHSPDMTAVWNMISPCPAISIPCGFDNHGLPIGAQLIGRRWRSDTLLDIAQILEAVVGPIGHPSNL
jgi:Asp-tRNA(Asn)/Glu-tRNA(Gln) amidotransferase A subunit family amidase